MGQRWEKIYLLLGGMLMIHAGLRAFFLPSLPSQFSDFSQMSSHPTVMLREWLIVELMFVFLLVSVGLWIIKQHWEALGKLTLLTASVLAFAGILEGGLHMGIFDFKKSSSPLWIPPPLKEMDKKIDEANMEFARQNPFFFTDVIHSEKKEAPIKKRIAAMGDSFVFGDGLPYQKTWSHQLEQIVKISHPDIEVLSWGQDGWSTKSQWEFLRVHALPFGINLIILGWNANDVDLEHISQIHLRWQESPLWDYPKKFFPYSFDFLVTLVNKVFERFIKSYGYANWLDRLYDHKELEVYGELLQKISRFCSENEIQILLVYTPSPSDLTEGSQYFEKIVPLANEAKIPFLNLYSPAIDRFNSTPSRQLWANPADAHPGEELSHFFAQEIYDYLASNKLLETNKPMELTRKTQLKR